MITKEKTIVYKKYQGDIDICARSSRKKEKELIEDRDWSLIENFIQDIKLVQRGLAADSYAADLQERLKTYCDSQEIIDEIQKLVEENKSEKKGSFITRLMKIFKPNHRDKPGS
jgi:hypothetical protein